MFIGIDFGLNASHTWKRREKGVITLIATRDKTFSKFYAQNEILECKKNYLLTIKECLLSSLALNLFLGSYCNIPFKKETTSFDKFVGTLYDPSSTFSTNSFILKASKAEFPISI